MQEKEFFMNGVLDSEIISQLETIQSSMSYGETDYYVSSMQNEDCGSCTGSCQGDCENSCKDDCPGSCEGHNR